MMNLCHSGVPVLFVLLVAGCSQAPPRPAAGDSPIAKFLADCKLQGSVVLVEFGTIGCSNSDKGLDAMADLQKRNAVPGLAYVRLEATGDDQSFKDYYAKKAVPFPVVRDHERKVADALGTAVFPQFVLVDKRGRVRFRGRQPAEKDLAEWAGKLQAEAADPGPQAAMFGTVELTGSDLLAATKLPDLAGAVKPLAEYRGRGGLMLVFVDTNCPYAGTVISQMPQVAPVLAAVGLPTVLVNIGEAADVVQDAYSGEAVGAPVLYDTGGETQARWNVQFVPTVVLLDNAGKIAYHDSPAWGDIAAAAETMLRLAQGSIKIGAEAIQGG